MTCNDMNDMNRNVMDMWNTDIASRMCCLVFLLKVFALGLDTTIEQGAAMPCVISISILALCCVILRFVPGPQPSLTAIVGLTGLWNFGNVGVFEVMTNA